MTAVRSQLVMPKLCDHSESRLGLPLSNIPGSAPGLLLNYYGLDQVYKYLLIFSLHGKSEPVLVLVFGNVGKGAFIFREQGILSNYFQGTRELRGRLLWSRKHLFTLHSSVTILYALIRG